MGAAQAPKDWLVLVFQFPQGSGSRRVKAWRRLQGIGAVAVRNSVYVLPDNEQSREDFEWLLAELTQAGAEAALMEARFINGLTDLQVRELFNAARDRDYQALAEEVEAAGTQLAAGAQPEPDVVHAARQALVRAQRQLADIEAIDFFGARELEKAQASLWALESRLADTSSSNAKGAPGMKDSPADKLQGRTWVTRRNVRVDRIASAWLIRRWIDRDARFKFVDGRDYAPGRDEVRFDMFEAEFTHEGDRCTLEVLAQMVAPGDAALRCVGEIVHDLDLKDRKFGRPETEGIASLLSGLVASLDSDEQRIERGSALFEDLYRHFTTAAD